MTSSETPSQRTADAPVAPPIPVVPTRLIYETKSAVSPFLVAIVAGFPALIFLLGVLCLVEAIAFETSKGATGDRGTDSTSSSSGGWILILFANLEFLLISLLLALFYPHKLRVDSKATVTVGTVLGQKLVSFQARSVILSASSPISQWHTMKLTTVGSGFVVIRCTKAIHQGRYRKIVLTPQDPDGFVLILRTLLEEARQQESEEQDLLDSLIYDT